MIIYLKNKYKRKDVHFKNKFNMICIQLLNIIKIIVMNFKKYKNLYNYIFNYNKKIKM